MDEIVSDSTKRPVVELIDHSVNFIGCETKSNELKILIDSPKELRVAANPNYFTCHEPL